MIKLATSFAEVLPKGAALKAKDLVAEDQALVAELCQLSWEAL